MAAPTGAPQSRGVGAGPGSPVPRGAVPVGCTRSQSRNVKRGWPLQPAVAGAVWGRGTRRSRKLIKGGVFLLKNLAGGSSAAGRPRGPGISWDVDESGEQKCHFS